MTELQQNRYDKLLRRVGGLIGAKSMVNDALGELFPMIDVETLNAELGLLSSWRLGFASTTQAALAANFNLSQIFNPAASGAIVILERVDFASDVSKQIRFALATAGLTNLTANHALRDTREGILVQPVTQIRDVQQVGGIAQFGSLNIQPGVNFTLNDKNGLFVLGPGTGVTFATTIVNSSLDVNYLWRERVAEASELQFG